MYGLIHSEWKEHRMLEDDKHKGTAREIRLTRMYRCELSHPKYLLIKIYLKCPRDKIGVKK